jgi:hypothetical protein
MSIKQQIFTSFIIGFGATSGALTAAGIVGAVSTYISTYISTKYLNPATNHSHIQDREASSPDYFDSVSNTLQMDDINLETQLLQNNNNKPLPYEGDMYAQVSIDAQKELFASNSHRFPM